MSSAWHRGPLVPALLFVACCALYAINLDKAPQFDELYHVLAARGFLETGHYQIANGVYTRAWPFTRLVALLFELLGEHLWVARLPSVVAVAAMTPLLFVWLRREGGTPAAWLGAGLFAVSPFAVDIAQFARFYGVHGLAFLVGSGLTYDVITRRPFGPSTAIRAVLGLAAFGIALIFQVTTLIGALGIALWAFLYLVGPGLLDRSIPLRRRLGVLAGLIVLGMAILAITAATGLLDHALILFRTTALWAKSNANDVAYYHVWLILYYPTLWTLLPILFVAGLVAKPRPAFFAGVVFSTALVLHSIGASKDLRYVFYIMPFLFVVWGIGLAAVLGRLIRYFDDHVGVALARLLPQRKLASLVSIVFVLSAVWLVAANAASVRTVLMLADVTMPPELPAVRWDLAEPVLEPLMKQADVVVVSSELESLYFLGRYDVLISRSRILERAEQMGREFSRDARTGRAVISTPYSVAKLMACFRSGIVITSIYRWRREAMLSDEIADLLVRRTTPVDLPRASLVMAFTWKDQPADPQISDCPNLQDQS